MEWHSTLENNDDELNEDVAIPILDDDNAGDNEGDNEVNPATLNRAQGSEIVLDDNQTSITVGNPEEKNDGEKSELNPLALSDIVATGHRKMVELNIPAIRHRRKSRQKRELKALQEELNTYLADENGSSKLKWILDALDNDSLASASDIRLEYRLMKKGCWITPAGSPPS
jgi:hypothetical protein